VDGGVLAGRFLVKGKPFAKSGRGREFGGSRLRYIAARESDQCMDLVKDVAVQGIRFLYRCAKRVISRDQNLIQLESLILAQSERWRQA
jgi:hypothetical protein